MGKEKRGGGESLGEEPRIKRKEQANKNIAFEKKKLQITKSPLTSW